MTLVKNAGVDLSSPEPIRIAVQEFEQVVTEMEQLEGQGVLESLSK
jgi:oligoendopeptidase F